MKLKSLLIVLLLVLGQFCVLIRSHELETDICAEEEDKHGAEERNDSTAGLHWCIHQKTYRGGGDRDCCDKEMVFDDKHLIQFLVLFVIIGYGALIRSILRATELPIPYTVVLMVSGLIFGGFSREFCDELEYYTEIARTPPKVILYLFLPVLIFESAFSIPVHTFMRSSGQILLAAFPGMIMATFLTAGVSMVFLSDYDWTFVEAALFGSIVSATDPVAVVAILRELGTSELLSVIIEGESLLNDGVAILFYEIFEGILNPHHEAKSDDLAGTIVTKFFVIAVGGPIFGWFMAKVAIMCLSRIFNDETVEVTITLVAAYLTYFVGEHMLGVSGVMAVVALGLTMSSERTCISPEVEHAVHHFWEMLGYLANTVLFVFVGIIIAESAFYDMEWQHLFYLIFLYLALNIIRLLMLLLLSPILSHIGYGLKWENMIIMMWGGLRGAVGLCLALEVYSGELCEKKGHLGPPFLFQTAGIVILTLVINGTSTKKLLQLLHLTDISAGRLQDMAGAHKALVTAQIRTVNTLKHDRFFADANWDVVVAFTTIENPYKKKAKVTIVPYVPSIISMRLERAENVTECPQCHTSVPNEPSEEEMKAMTEEARCRLIKALKVSFWKQFERGVLLELSTQILSGVADDYEDFELKMIHAEDLKKFWTIHGIFAWIRAHLVHSTDAFRTKPCLRRPANSFFRFFWWLSTREWFDGLVFLVIIANIIPIGLELAILLKEKEQSQSDVKTYLLVNVCFLAFYAFEFLVKILGRGAKEYFTSAWNYIDFGVLILGVADIVITLNEIANTDARVVLKVLRALRLLRVIRLPRYLLPKIHLFVEGRINQQLFVGYDIAKGFVTALDEALKRISFISENATVVYKLRHSLEKQRVETIRAMGKLQAEYPTIAIAVKTRHASRQVLNQMRDYLVELNEDGLVDEKAHLLLTSIIEESMKKLWHSPASVPNAAEIQIGNLSSLDDAVVYPRRIKSRRNSHLKTGVRKKSLSRISAHRKKSLSDARQERDRRPPSN